MSADNTRTAFANNLKSVLKEYEFDGVDLDIEWPTTETEYANYSATIVKIRQILGKDVCFSVSLHPVAYKISKNAIEALDFMSYQCYGPAVMRYSYEQFVKDAEMAVEYGAKTAYTDVVRMNPSVHSENGVNSSLSAARAEGGIMVNLDGKRFCNDYYPDYTQLSRWLQKQKGSIAYIVIDNKAMKASKRLQGFKDKGYFLQADTLAELAKKMGVPPKALEETAKRYSEFVKNGKDLDFGRQHNLTLDFSQPPYYAVKTQPGIQVTLGGIDVNNNMQVIKKDGGFFPNLYAAGEVTYDGSFRPGPTAVGLYQGHIAAQNILRKSN